MAPTITWTLTDESPRLATAVLLPIVTAFLGKVGIEVDVADLSLAGRVLAANDHGPDDLARLGTLARSGQANIVKLPNISASAGQIEACIAELNAQGAGLPTYQDDPSRYDAVKGSAVNPVLREGNSDRRAPGCVKTQAQTHPHWMGEWHPSSATRVLTMANGDFRHTEQSVTIREATTVSIMLRQADGTEQALYPSLALQAGEILDAAVMQAEALADFLVHAHRTAQESPNITLGAHLKATMMKVTDPVIFGRTIATWFAPQIAAYADQLTGTGWTPEQGLGALASALGDDGPERVAAMITEPPMIAMTDANAGVSALHAPNTTIIDASMPAMIRAGGQMAGPDGVLYDTLAVIPDSTYAEVYQVVIDDCKANGAFDPATMGTVPNVGLMAQKAEEYGSHDKTFVIDTAGEVIIRDDHGTVLTRHAVSPGDLWRACQTKAAPIRDWVRLAIRRATITGWPAVFWLDAARAHDAELLKVVADELDRHNLDGVDIRILPLAQATAFTLERARRGEHTISVTGNVLRDYLTDLFPILELGTSARMLSIVPLMAGGGLYETGAGGTAPLLMNQLLAENHLQWDSLGEYMALVPALEQVASDHGLPEAQTLATTLDQAILGYLQGDHTPQTHVGGNDTRTAGYWIARLWAQAITDQEDHPALAEAFLPLAQALTQGESAILAELQAPQGSQADLGGYYRPDPQRLAAVMCPSARFNDLIDQL